MTDGLRNKKHVLSIHDVYKRYGSKLVLDNVDLLVSGGEICSLVGPSGCGKSTLFRMIVGEERPSAGEILIDGKPIGYPDRSRGIVYQKYTLFPYLSVIKNVLLGPECITGAVGSRIHAKELREEAMFYLEQVKLAEHKDKYPHELSGGMQQRVALAQALVMKPRILLMDEPFGALDPGTREHLQVFLLELWEKFHMTIFFVTHDPDEAVFVGTRILVLSQFYTDDRGPDFPRGSKIVFDHALPRRAHSTVVKDSPEFRELIQQIRRVGSSSAYLQHVDQFNLDHPDSFRTLTAEEKKK